MKQITKTIYRFAELSEDVKKKLIEKNRYAEANQCWWRDVYANIDRYGIKITEFDIDRDEITIKLDFSNAYTAEKLAIDGSEREKQIAECFFASSRKPEDCRVFVLSLKRYYLELLKEEAEYITSDEYISELLEGWDYWYDKNGNIENDESE